MSSNILKFYSSVTAIKINKSFVLIAGCLLAALPVRATLVAYEGFDYTAGDSIVGKSGGSGWNSGWGGNGTTQALVSSTEITYNLDGTILGGGNSMVFNNSAASPILERDVFASLDTSGQDYYVSFIFQTGGAGVNNGTFFSWQAKDNAPQVNVGNLGVVSNGNPGARINSDTTNVSSTVTNDITHFMVVAFTGWSATNLRYQETKVWFNPSINDENTSDPNIIASQLAANATDGAPGFLGLWARATNFNGTDEVVYFDDMRVGTTWSSVTAIPETGTYATLLASASLLFILYLRRNKSK